MYKSTVLTEVQNNIGTITINRPDRHNALNDETLHAFELAIDDMAKNNDVYVVVITGAGDKAFVAGGDLAEMEHRRAIAHYDEFAEDIHRIFRKVEILEKPTIAAVNGWALGGGTELLLCTDIRILSDKAVLALPEISLGLFPGAGGTQRAIRQLAPCVAKEMMFTGDRIDANEAVRIGLANRVVAHAELMDTAMAMAAKIASKSPKVIKYLKRTLSDGADMPLAAALSHEKAVVSLVFDLEDAHEGINAFLEKRNPSFTGR